MIRKCELCNNKETIGKKATSKICRNCRARLSCTKTNKLTDVIGKKLGKLMIEKRIENTKLLRCLCDCGNTAVIDGYKILSGHTKSCGCLYRTKKGLSGKPTYNSWHSMIQRCYNPTFKCYKWYGDRGITVCERWKNSFANFFEDMGERPLGKTLDRIDNMGNYDPINCRWSTYKEQCANRRKQSFK